MSTPHPLCFPKSAVMPIRWKALDLRATTLNRNIPIECDKPNCRCSMSRLGGPAISHSLVHDLTTGMPISQLSRSSTTLVAVCSFLVFVLCIVGCGVQDSHVIGHVSSIVTLEVSFLSLPRFRPFWASLLSSSCRRVK